MYEDAALDTIERIITNNFKDVLIWEQRSGGLRGKYFYVKYEKKEIGVFVGYIMDDSYNIEGCTTFFFVHPALSMSTAEVSRIERLFHKIMIRANISLRSHPYRFIKSGLPALVRSIYFDSNCTIDISTNFFEESLAIMKQYQALYLK